MSLVPPRASSREHIPGCINLPQYKATTISAPTISTAAECLNAFPGSDLRLTATHFHYPRRVHVLGLSSLQTSRRGDKSAFYQSIGPRSLTCNFKSLEMLINFFLHQTVILLIKLQIKCETKLKQKQSIKIKK